MPSAPRTRDHRPPRGARMHSFGADARAPGRIAVAGTCHAASMVSLFPRPRPPTWRCGACCACRPLRAVAAGRAALKALAALGAEPVPLFLAVRALLAATLQAQLAQLPGDTTRLTAKTAYNFPPLEPSHEPTKKAGQNTYEICVSIAEHLKGKLGFPSADLRGSATEREPLRAWSKYCHALMRGRAPVCPLGFQAWRKAFPAAGGLAQYARSKIWPVVPYPTSPRFFQVRVRNAVLMPILNPADPKKEVYQALSQDRAALERWAQAAHALLREGKHELIKPFVE